MRENNDALVQSKAQTEWTGFDEQPEGTESESVPAEATPGETTAETIPQEEPKPQENGEQGQQPPPANAPKRDPNRVRLARFADNDRQTILRATEKGIDLDAARAELIAEGVIKAEAAQQPNPDNRQAAANGSPNPAQASDPIAKQQGVVADLEKQIEDAGAAFDTAALAKLNIQHNKALAELGRMEAKAVAAQSQAAATETQRNAGLISESEKAAISMFPDAGKEGSPLYEAIEDLIDAAHPDAFKDPDWPVTFAARAASKIGYKPSAAAAAQTPPPVVPRKPARPVPPNPASGNAAPAEAPRGPNLEQQIAEAESKGDVTTLRRLLRENGTRSLA